MRGRWFSFVCVVFFASCQAARAEDPYRRQLQDVLFYQRLVDGGSGLAYQTYASRELASRAAGRDEIARASAYFCALAAMELGQREVARESLSAYSWDENSPLHNDARKLIELFDVEEGQRDSSRWPSQEQPSFQPSYSKTIDGTVPIEYQFFDPRLFRQAAEHATQVLYQSASGSDSMDAVLVSLWCELWLKQFDIATTRVQELQSMAVAKQLSTDQIAELQFLAAALAQQAGQSDPTSKLLASRLAKPPTSPWPLRAMHLTDGHLEQKFDLLHQVVASDCRGQHPFATTVLTNQPATAERILDNYWEVAWAYRCRAIEQGRWQPSESAGAAALGCQSLTAELMSPTVAESWRQLSPLRIELLMEAGVLSGDAESWQLVVSPAAIEQFPVLNVVIELSRTLSGLRRTQPNSKNVEQLVGHRTKAVTALLLGEDHSGQVAETLVAASSESRANYGFFVTAFLSMIVVVVILLRKRAPNR